MKVKLLGAIAVALLIILVFAVVAVAVPQATIDAIIKDAQNGTLEGTWTAEQVQAALGALQNDPLYAAYSDSAGVLEDYLASLQAPGDQNGQLAFTGSELLLVLAAGAGLIGGGALLRRSRA